MSPEAHDASGPSATIPAGSAGIAGAPAARAPDGAFARLAAARGVGPLALVVALAAVAGEALLLAALLGAGDLVLEPPAWLALHALASVAAAGAATVSIARLSAERPARVLALCLALAACLPLVGALGTLGALVPGLRRAGARHREVVYWQFTANPELPFTTPIGRPVAGLDGRGFAEQLQHGDDPDALYRKVLAAGRIRSSLSIDALSAAIRHPDERIRLTAYQTLDRKVSRLNAEIQRLEAAAAGEAGRARSDTWLQIASNYWELLTLEQGEPVAREQLLDKAARAALQAIVIRPDNRNAHFTLGRIALRQGLPARARVAFERATALGMPAQKTLPYLAEAAFDARELDRVGPLLAAIDDAFKAYPPLRQVAEQWR